MADSDGNREEKITHEESGQRIHHLDVSKGLEFLGKLSIAAVACALVSSYTLHLLRAIDGGYPLYLVTPAAEDVIAAFPASVCSAIVSIPSFLALRAIYSNAGKEGAIHSPEMRIVGLTAGIIVLLIAAACAHSLFSIILLCAIIVIIGLLLSSGLKSGCVLALAAKCKVLGYLYSFLFGLRIGMLIVSALLLASLLFSFAITFISPILIAVAATLVVASFAIVGSFCLGRGLRKAVDSGRFECMNSFESNSVEALRVGLIVVVLFLSVSMACGAIAFSVSASQLAEFQIVHNGKKYEILDVFAGSEVIVRGPIESDQSTENVDAQAIRRLKLDGEWAIVEAER